MDYSVKKEKSAQNNFQTLIHRSTLFENVFSQSGPQLTYLEQFKIFADWIYQSEFKSQSKEQTTPTTVTITSNVKPTPTASTKIEPIFTPLQKTPLSKTSSVPLKKQTPKIDLKFSRRLNFYHPSRVIKNFKE